MKRGLKFGCLFTLALPFGCAFGSDQLKDDMSSTIQSLEAITSKVDDAPALLLLTPSQLEAVSPPVEKEVPPNPPDAHQAREPASRVQRLKWPN
ncbi:hypothetical protein ACQ86O_10730 [Serratia sp. L9]|uniref:hypothetical protein n=1 Tax=Serratia sp. L9 TaxID=3423946 RepID=UPI003D678268